MVRINLLPAVRVSRKKQASKQQLLLFALAIVLGVLVNWMWASARVSELERRQTQLRRTKEEIAQLDRIIGEVKNIKAQQQQLREKLDVLARLKEGRTGPVRMLDELATVTPKRLWLTRFDERNGAAKLTGVGATLDDVSEFMSALKRSTHFRNVELEKTTARGEKSGLRLVDFSMSASVLYAPKAAATAVAQADGSKAKSDGAPATAGAK